jgi:two-component system phosphate regulon sensor histidine kinase PhoR
MERLKRPPLGLKPEPGGESPWIRRGEQAEKVLNAAIVGGGNACYNLLQLLDEDRLSGLRIRILGVSDINPESPGFRYAESRNLQTTADLRDLFKIKDLNIIIELTGSPEVRDTIYRIRPPDVSVIDHRAARLLWDLIEKEVEKSELEKERLKYQEENIRNLYDLSLEKSRLKTIINCMANGVMVTNRNREIVLHNPAFIRLMGLQEDLKTPLPLSDFIKDPSLIQTLDEILNREFTENEFISQEIQVGENVLRAISAPALGIDRNVFLCVVGTVTVLEDITAFKRLDKLKSDFVNMVAHELRSPLVSIRQIDSVLLEGLAGDLEGKQKDLVSKGLVKIDTLLDLISDLLDVARIEEGKFIRRQVPTDIRMIIEEIAALIEPRAKHQGIILTCSFENLRPVQADPKNIEEICNNLISNAVNYSPAGGRVTVTASGVGDHIEIRVEDTGVGIPPEELPKIFDRFYRVKHPKTRRVTGTGLGLYIVKGIVEALQGTIDVESVPDQGTTFKIILPLFPQHHGL